MNSNKPRLSNSNRNGRIQNTAITRHADSRAIRANGMRNICVYCGSGKGRTRAYAAAARTLGRELTRNGIGLVYGGGSLGLMGEIARATLQSGGRVTGVIPAFLTEKEKMLREVSELIVTEDMHQRKMVMFQKSDAFVALPGGVGTLEELVEQLTWSQLGRHEKPIIIANIGGFWTPFLALLEHMRAETFIRSGLEVRCSVVDRVQDIIPASLGEYRPPARPERARAVMARM